eukprot:10632533-Lingulodinium_polyedra.AAC.1
MVHDDRQLNARIESSLGPQKASGCVHGARAYRPEICGRSTARSISLSCHGVVVYCPVPDQ